MRPKWFIFGAFLLHAVPALVMGYAALWDHDFSPLQWQAASGLAVFGGFGAFIAGTYPDSKQEAT